MKRLKKKKNAGILEAYKDGKKVGDIKTMGDEVKKNGSNDEVRNKNR